MFGFALSCPSIAGEIRITSTDQAWPVLGSTQFKKDTSSESFEVIRENSEQFEDGEGSTLSFGFVNHPYWFYFDVINETDEEQMYLVFEYALLDHISIFIDSGSEVQKIELGDLQPFTSRDVQAMKLIAPLDLEKGVKKRIFYRIETYSSLNAKAYLATVDHFWSDHQNHLMLNGVYFGSLLVMVIYNLFVFMVVRSRSYLYYVLYVFTYLLGQLCVSGYDYQYLWPASPYLHSFMLPMTISLCLGFLAQFTSCFLDLKSHFPRINRAIKACAAISFLAAFASFFVEYKYMASVTSGLGFLVASSCMLAGLMGLRRTVGIPVLLSGIFFFTLRWTDVFCQKFWTGSQQFCHRF